MLWWLSTPKITSRDFSACPLIRPWNLAIMARAGFPGIIRGRKKLSVTAAQRVSTKNPARRRANLMAARPPPLLGRQVQQHLAHVGVVVGGRQRVRVARRRPGGGLG